MIAESTSRRLSETCSPMRVPRHVGFIPDGNRRWAEARGLGRHEGYAAGVAPGLALIDECRALGIEEVSIYGFTIENTHRSRAQVDAFRRACVEFAERVLDTGAALLVIGDDRPRTFPVELRPLTLRRSAGDLRVNLLVNYGWQWDLTTAQGVRGTRAEPLAGLRSHGASRIELVVRWGGRQRLSGFLPVQCAYADLHVIDTLWPDMQLAEFRGALHWFAQQEVTLGG